MLFEFLAWDLDYKYINMYMGYIMCSTFYLEVSVFNRNLSENRKILRSLENLL